MEFRLPVEAVAAGYGLRAYDSVESTNPEALGLLRENGSPTWAVAAEQRAGRGRRGNAWVSPRGNLYASVAMAVDASPTLLGTLGFVAGLATIRALEALVPDPARLRLKWPNDVLANGRKLVGILLESEPLGRGPDRVVVVGIGINVAAAPSGTPYGATTLVELGSDARPPQVFAALAREWAAAFRLWNGGTGFPAVREAWLSRAAGIGDSVTVRLPRETFAGTFMTIDPTGRLVLTDDGGTTRTVSAGEVFFGRDALAGAAA